MSTLDLSQAFTKTNLFKTLKSAAFSAAAAFTLVVLNWLGTVEISNPIFAVLLPNIIAPIITAIREYNRSDR